MRDKGLKIGFVFFGLLAIASLTFFLVRQSRDASAPLPVYGTVEQFHLLDQDGQAFGSERMQGKVHVVNFIFTSCPAMCPVLSKRMAEIQKESEERMPQLELVSISVDPQTDTPKVLREYGQKHGANFARWKFLTGPVAMVKQAVVTSFMTAMGKVDGDIGKPSSPDDWNEIAHAEHFVLVDSQGRIRAFRRVEGQRNVREIVSLALRLAERPDKT